MTKLKVAAALQPLDLRGRVFLAALYGSLALAFGVLCWSVWIIGVLIGAWLRR